MTLYRGGQRIAKLYKGSTPIARAYKGEIPVFVDQLEFTQSFLETLNENESHSSTTSLRTVIPAASLGASGTHFQVRLIGHTANSSIIDDVSVMERSGSTAAGATAPVRITFNGGATGVTISANGEVWSDIIAHPIDASKDYLFTFDGTPTWYHRRSTASGFSRYATAAGAKAMQQAATDYGSEVASRRSFIAEILVGN